MKKPCPLVTAPTQAFRQRIFWPPPSLSTHAGAAAEAAAVVKFRFFSDEDLATVDAGSQIFVCQGGDLTTAVAFAVAPAWVLSGGDGKTSFD
jgi:hypothetical protein